MKNIIITGACGHIGNQLINFFLKNKNYNICAIDIFTEKNKKQLNKLSKINNFNFYLCDLSNLQEVKNVTIEINKKYKHINCIINNAGVTGTFLKKGWNENFLNQDVNNFDYAYRVNVSSVFYLIQLLSNKLKKKNSSIVNISSIYSKLAHDKKIYKNTNIYNPAGYSASKSGLNQLTRWLASELAPKVRVNSILLGGISRKQSSMFKKNYINKTLLKRMASEKDVINLVDFLLSNKSSYITGQEIFLDGGYSII